MHTPNIGKCGSYNNKYTSAIHTLVYRLKQYQFNSLVYIIGIRY